ncbi:hypothetical protein BH11PSE10_BH11PSE10_06150 [soil metagenome]
MIFVTVGTQLPFDRLVKAVDAWAEHNPGVEIFGQIGPGGYKPRHFPSTEFLSPTEVARNIARAELVVGHAGMGTVVSSLTNRVPIILLPRRQALREHRSDHQMTTVKWLREELQLNVLLEIDELAAILDSRSSLRPGREIGGFAKPGLIKAIREFVECDARDPSVIDGLSAWIAGLRKMLSDRSSRISHGTVPPETS